MHRIRVPNHFLLLSIEDSRRRNGSQKRQFASRLTYCRATYCTHISFTTHEQPEHHVWCCGVYVHSGVESDIGRWKPVRDGNTYFKQSTSHPESTSQWHSGTSSVDTRPFKELSVYWLACRYQAGKIVYISGYSV